MEKLKNGERNSKITPIVRVFPICLKTTSEILSQFENVKNGLQPQIELCDVYLGLKSADSVPSPNMINAIGGKINPQESLWQEAIKKVNEVSSLVCIPATEEEMKKFIIEGNYTYEIPGIMSDTNRRKTSLLILPVINPEILLSISPSERTKFTRLIGLTVNQFAEAVTCGELPVKLGDQEEKLSLVGSLTKITKPTDIVESKTGKKNRKNSLNKLSKKLRNIEF